MVNERDLVVAASFLVLYVITPGSRLRGSIVSAPRQEASSRQHEAAGTPLEGRVHASDLH